MCIALLPLFIFPSVIFGAVIEVTAGGSTSDPTYRFSDSSGNSLSTLVGSATMISASADLQTGNGNSIDTMAAQIATLQNQIEGLLAAGSYSYTYASTGAGSCPGGTTAVTNQYECRYVAQPRLTGTNPKYGGGAGELYIQGSASAHCFSMPFGGHAYYVFFGGYYYSSTHSRVCRNN
jgi:hypothetical protein